MRLDEIAREKTAWRVVNFRRNSDEARLFFVGLRVACRRWFFMQEFQEPIPPAAPQTLECYVQYARHFAVSTAPLVADLEKTAANDEISFRRTAM